MAKQTKAEKAQAARELAEKMRVSKQATDKRNKMIFSISIGVIVVALIGVIAYVLIHNATASSKVVSDAIDSGQGPTSVWASDGSITISKNGAGADNAIKGKPTLDIFNDFICPSCGSFENALGDEIETLVLSGDLNVRYHPLGWFNNTSPQYSGSKPTGKSYGYSIRAAAAAIYIGEHAPDKYMDFVKVMYAPGNQPEEATKYDEKLGSNDSIAARAVQAGVSEDIAKAAVTGGTVTSEQLRVKGLEPVAGLTGGPYLQYAYAVGALASDKGFNGKEIKGTPAIYLNGSEYTYTNGKSMKTADEFADDVKNAK